MSHPLHPDTRVLTGASDIEEAIAASAWPEQARPDRLGIEVEAFPIVIGDDGPAGRLRLHDGEPGVIDIVGELAAAHPEFLGSPTDDLAFPTRSGGRVTFEPGGQIEHSTAPAATTADVATETREVWAGLRDTFWSHRVCLVSLGIDPWTEGAAIPQQLPGGRYRAMDTYLAARGPAGATMMRNTCSIQVNLDSGNGETRRERWLAANLLSPLLTAMFASSPGPNARSLRAQAWQSLDTTRTGFPTWSQPDHADPVGDTVARALAADVMLITRDDTTTPGYPGWTFRDWLADGHPSAGPPTVADLETHLTTLFTEVRPRYGVLELRGIDGLPEAWWQVPLVLAAALLYDAPARSRVIELLTPLAPRLNSAWHRAAADGMADREIAQLSMTVGELAMAAARRDPVRFDGRDVTSAGAFLDRFTYRGTSPADQLSSRLTDPATALAWAAPEHATKGAA